MPIMVKQIEYYTCDDTHKVDLGPPRRGFPSYFPNLVSYLMITASTEFPF